jgi:hypothetical protein
MDEIYEQLCWAHVCMEHGWRLSLWYITRGFYLSLLERVFHVKSLCPLHVFLFVLYYLLLTFITITIIEKISSDKR